MLRLTSSCMTTLGLMALASSGVSASENESTGATVGTLEEITVTARKREEVMQDVPVSIAVFSASDLANKSLTNLFQVGQFTPNLIFGRHGSRATSSTIFIRGIGQSEARIYFDPGVGFYVDGVYMGRMQGIDMDTMGLERVEILRGPQGTLFGKNTIGGAINVVTTKPHDEFSGSMEVITGEYDRFDVSGMVNVPIVPGKLAALFTGAVRSRDGYGKRLDFATGKETEDMGDVDRSSGRALIQWTPSDALDVFLAVDGTRVREKNGVIKNTVFNADAFFPSLLNQFVDPPYGNAFLTNSDFTSNATGGNANEFDGWGAALTVNWDLGGPALKSITSYRSQEGVNLIEPDGSPYSLLDLMNTTDQDQFSQELQLSGDSFDDRLSWVLGLYYFQEQGEERERNAVARELLPYTGLDLSFDTRYTTDNESYAVYGQGTYNLTDQLSLTVGARYSDESKTVTRESLSYLDDAVLVPRASRDGSWDAFSGRLGLEYHWNEDVMTYVSVANGFKSGGIFGNASSDADFQTWDPEYLTTYELGVKSDLLAQRLRLNATLFYGDYEDTQFTVQRGTETGPVRTIDNAAAARIQGFELEAVALPVNNLTVKAGVGYTDTKYTDFDPTIGIGKDTKFAATPEWIVTASADYVIPIGAWGDLTPRLDYAYKSKIYYDALNSPFVIQEPYGLLNAKIDFETASGHWLFSVFGTNLTDEHYINSGNDVYAAFGIVTVQYERPREWGASIRYNF